MPNSPTPPPALVREVQYALRAMGMRLGRLNDAVAGLVDLKGGDIELLDHIGRVGPVSPGELAAQLHVHPATMTGILDRLEKGGWIVRERDSPDRRKVQLRAIRTRGPELVRLYAPMNTAIVEICASFTTEQLTAIRDFLVGIGTAAAEATDEADK
jgi:DNA-binding MarR family transcriptional regulator